ncbi:MAG: hypothetical protein QE271_08750 [Bacteriovoracaceae bacterium]|nr:hypothetical protein [Bacteriovoracaceae bacterium]
MMKILVIATDDPDYLGEHIYYYNEITLNDATHYPLSGSNKHSLKLTLDPTLPGQFRFNTETNSIKQNHKIAPASGVGIKNDTFTLGNLIFQVMDFELEKPYHRDEEWKSALQDPRNLRPSAQRAIANLLDETED